jgi:hypothetical protein
MRSSRAVVALLLILVLAACGVPVAPTDEDYAHANDPTIRPGQAFRFPSENHVTLPGDYTLPSGTYRVDFGCAGEVDYRIDDQSGRRNGKCVQTGLSNTASEPSVTGPGTLGIAIVTQGAFVNVTLK